MTRVFAVLVRAVAIVIDGAPRKISRAHSGRKRTFPVARSAKTGPDEASRMHGGRTSLSSVHFFSGVYVDTRPVPANYF